MKLLNNSIGDDYGPYIIAEMSGNHNHSLERAKQIIKAAADSGVNAIKLQTYTADTLTLDHSGDFFEISDPDSLWRGKNLYALYKEAYTPWEWHEPLFNYARELGITPFSSPFDETAVDFLESLGVPFYKIASFENNHFPLLKKVAQTGKPVIMSTGISSINDIRESVEVLKKNGCKEIILLKCTSTYPASPENTNLATIPHLKQVFPDCVIGLSDHTLGIGVAVASVALGARVIEKHFTLKRSDGGVDSTFSMEPEEMKSLAEESHRAWQAIGKVQTEVQEAEMKSLKFKRSIFVSSDIQEGELITEKNIRIVRPGNGLHPKHYESLLGKKANRNLKKGTPFSLDYIM